MHVVGLDHIVVNTQDVERAMHFYHEARLSHRNFTRLSNASNLLGQSAKSSIAS
jgi:hypothetical protein